MNILLFFGVILAICATVCAVCLYSILYKKNYVISSLKINRNLIITLSFSILWWYVRIFFSTKDHINNATAYDKMQLLYTIHVTSPHNSGCIFTLYPIVLRSHGIYFR